MSADQEFNKSKARILFLLHIARSALIGLVSSVRLSVSNERGFNLISGCSSHGGLGTAAQIVEDLATRNGIPVNRIYFDDQNTPFITENLIYKNTIAVVAPGHLAFLRLVMPRIFGKKRKRAALLFWEVDLVPIHIIHAVKMLECVLSPSEFVGNILESSSQVRTTYFPMPLEIDRHPVEPLIRRRLQLQDQFLFCFQCDLSSGVARKNPIAVVEAYKMAFPEESTDTHLLLKTSNAVIDSENWNQLQNEALLRPDITLINAIWSQLVVDSLYQEIDCYVSLHRSEGFGLTIAQAISSNKPVIATDYGGCKELIELSGCFPVDYAVIPCSATEIYPAGSHWADPHREHASQLMRKVYTEYRNGLSEQDKENRRQAITIREKTASSVVQEFIS
jgi:glycosyltransferase involved in cell wall biosynthesis